MKKGKPILFFLLCIALIPMAFALSVESQYPKTMTQFQEADAKLIISTEGQEIFDVVSILPHGWEITDWHATTPNVFAESRDTTYLSKIHSVYRWRIECKEPTVEIAIKLIPITGGNNEITTLWLYSGGFDSKSTNVFVTSSVDTPTPQNMTLLVILLAATVIAIGGVAYREYQKIKSGGYKKKTSKKRRS